MHLQVNPRQASWVANNKWKPPTPPMPRVALSGLVRRRAWLSAGGVALNTRQKAEIALVVARMASASNTAAPTAASAATTTRSSTLMAAATFSAPVPCLSNQRNRRVTHRCTHAWVRMLHRAQLTYKLSAKVAAAASHLRRCSVDSFVKLMHAVRKGAITSTCRSCRSVGSCQ